MNEDGNHQDSEYHMAEHGGPSLDSETGSEMLGKSAENSQESGAGDLVCGRGVGMPSKISEMPSDLLRPSPYGLWMSSAASVMGNADWRDKGLIRDGSGYWPSLFPVSSIPTVAAAATGKNIVFDSPQEMPVSGSDASTISRNSTIERTASSDSSGVKKELARFRPGREQEQFNLWKMASLIHNITPSENHKRSGSDEKDGALYPTGSLVDDGKTAGRSWNAISGENGHQARTKLAPRGILYPAFGSEAGNGDFDPARKPHLSEKTVEGQGVGDTVVIRNRKDNQPMFVLNLKPLEQLPANSGADVHARMKLNHTQSCSQSSEVSEDHRDGRTRDAEADKLPQYDSMKGPSENRDDTQIPVSSSRSLQHEDIAGKCIEASTAESVLSESAGVKDTQDKIPASLFPVSQSTSNGSSLYRRRVKNLLLKRGNSQTEATEAELPKSPRIQNHFASAFDREDSSSGDAAPDSGCGNFHREKRDWERTDDVSRETDVALCHSAKESECMNRHVATGTGCNSGSPVEQQEASKSDKPSGISCGVVNYATVSSGQDYRPCVSGMDCGCTGQMTKDGMRAAAACVEKGLYLNAGGLCCHGIASHSACQCCSDIAASCHPSPLCHLPVKMSPACDVATTKCCVAHRLGSLPTPTRACAAALCQLSSSGGILAHVGGSPKCMETSSGCPFSHPGNQCTTPCHQAIVKCSCIGDCRSATGCRHAAKKVLPRACPARIFHQETTRPHTPCMAHTPYTPRETVTPREPDTPQATDGVGEPCTPQSICSHRAPRKYPGCTPTTACYFQFPPLHAVPVEFPVGGVCPTPSCLSYARRLPPCHTPCMSPLNLTIRQPCIAHSRTPQCCCPHQKLSQSADHLRHSCVRTEH